MCLFSWGTPWPRTRILISEYYKKTEILFIAINFDIQTHYTLLPRINRFSCVYHVRYSFFSLLKPHVIYNISIFINVNNMLFCYSGNRFNQRIFNLFKNIESLVAFIHTILFSNTDQQWRHSSTLVFIGHVHVRVIVT